MYEMAAEIIQEYVDQWLFEPNYGWPKIEFIRRSYFRWAANEILNRIKTETKGRTVADIIEEFWCEMDSYSEVNYDRDLAFIFETAKETAEDISSLFDLKGDWYI